MKNKTIVIGAVVVSVVLVLIWWNRETAFLNFVNSENISKISVRDGQTGNIFDIDDKDDINYIIRNIQKQSYRKSGISLLRMGTHFTLFFYNEDGKRVDEFIVNSDDTIRKDPFFYKTDESMDIVDFLDDIENNQA